MDRSVLLLPLFLFAATGSAAELSAHQRLTFDIYKELVEIRTVHPDGDNTAAARAMAARLLAAGFDPKDVQVFEPDPHSGAAIRVEHWVVAERQGQTAAQQARRTGEVRHRSVLLEPALRHPRSTTSATPSGGTSWPLTEISQSATARSDTSAMPACLPSPRSTVMPKA